MLISKCKLLSTWRRLFSEGTAYISMAEPRVFMTVCILNCSVLVTKTYSFNNEMRVGKCTTLFLSYSMTKKNHTSKIPSTVQLLIEEKQSLG